MRLHSPLRHLVLVTLMIGVLGTTAAPAFAGIMVSSETVTATPGSTGFVQILLTNDGLTSLSLSGFSVEMNLNGTGVQFAGVDDLTSPAYVFDGIGLGDLTFDTFPNNGFIASDLSLNLDGFVDVAGGQTVGLARIAFEVDSAATGGLRPISFVLGPTTVFTDAVGDPFLDSSVSFSNGGINVQGAVGVVPEPSSITLFGIMVGGALAAHRRRRAIRNLSQCSLA